MSAVGKDEAVQNDTHEGGKGDADSTAALILQIQILTRRYTQKHPAVKKRRLSLAGGC